MAKKYYWLKLKSDFFTQATVKLLRRSKYADKAAVIYLQLLLWSVGNEGKIVFEGVCNDCFDEIAVVLDEDTETVKDVCKMLENMKRLEVYDGSAFLPEASECLGSESDSAARMRKYRKKEAETSHCDANVTACDGVVTRCDIEKRRVEESRGEKEKSAYALQKKRAQVRFNTPTLEDVKAYCLERKNGIDAQRFIDYYTANGWKVGKNSMKDWKAAVRTWERNEQNPAAPQPERPREQAADVFAEYRRLKPEELDSLRKSGVLDEKGAADFAKAEETGLYSLLQKAGVAV